MRVWDVDNGQVVNEPPHGHTDPVTCVAISSDGKTFESGREEGPKDMIRKVSELDNEEVVEKPLQGHTYWLRCVAISGDGK